MTDGPQTTTMHGLIIGGSSQLAASLAPLLADAGTKTITLTQHRRVEPVRALAQTLSCRTRIASCDVTDTDALRDLANAELDFARQAGATLLVVYCCGAWRHGRLGQLASGHLTHAWTVGASAPHRLANYLMRPDGPGVRFVMVSGSSGPANHLAGNSIYAMVCDAARAMVACLGAECLESIREGGPDRFAAGVQLGLVQKGQPWSAAFEKETGLRFAPDYTEAAQVCALLLSGGLPSASGSVFELRGDMRTYAPLLDFLASGQTRSRAERAEQVT